MGTEDLGADTIKIEDLSRTIGAIIISIEETLHKPRTTTRNPTVQIEALVSTVEKKDTSHVIVAKAKLIKPTSLTGMHH